MIDFHSHILPGIDDGAKDIEKSLLMLGECKKNGVETVVLTPHCYFTEDVDIRDFIINRNEKYRLLKEAIKNSGEEFPELRLGCELYLNNQHRNSAFLKELAIEGTNYIMLEMPVGEWDSEIYETIYTITLKGLRPMLAHIDRYYLEHREDFHNLFSFDLAYQVNCGAFLFSKFKKNMPYFFEHGAIHVLGSDMHNLSTRNTKMAECEKVLKTAYDMEYYNYLKRNGELIINNKETEIKFFEKMSFFKKLKI